MYRNYLKTTLRNFRKNKFFTALNIVGLSLGMTTCMLIRLYVYDELSYDKFNSNVDNIYRVNNEVKFGGVNVDVAQTPALLGITAVTEIPGIKKYTRLRLHESILVKKGSVNLREARVGYSDSTLFEVFSLPMIDGDPGTALVNPRSVVINESIASKYFNRTDVVGRILTINDTSVYKITGVIKDIPANSHFNFDFILPFSETKMSVDEDWLSQNFNTYLQIENDADIQLIDRQLNALLSRKLEPDLKNLLGVDLKEFNSQGNFTRLSLTALRDIHLHSNRLGELKPGGNIMYVYIFSLAAFLIMIIACVNFMNLFIARSSARAREIGIRKVLGSLRKNLIHQFLAESMLMSLVAFLFAILLTILLLPYFNQLAGKDFSTGIFLRPVVFISFISIALLVGMLSGSYPAFLLSSLQPGKVLKGKVKTGFKGGWLRNSLVILQFSISIILIIGTVVIYSQLTYMHKKDVGFNRQQILVIHNTDVLKNQVGSFGEEVRKISAVKSITITGYLPVNGERNNNGFFMSPIPDAKSAIAMQSWYVDQNYIPTFDIEMLEGRNFSREFSSDSTAVLVNESAAALLGKKNLMHKKLFVMSDNDNTILKEYNVIGKFRNFNFNSLREAVTPLALFLGNEKSSMALRLDGINVAATLEKVKMKWQATQSGHPFDYSFMDEQFNQNYLAETRMGRIFVSFAVLAMIVACMGLFALVAYAADQRIREIGIRKILGASMYGIVRMLSFEFLKLVAIAGLISIPIAWWLMDKWLRDFAYRIMLSGWSFVPPLIIVLGVSFITVGFQAIKAAGANPIKSLRAD